MSRRLWIRVGLVVFVVLLAVFYLYPPRKTINLGLDLQGGIHLVLGVDIDKALEVQTERVGDTVRAALEKKGVGVKSIERRGTTELVVQLASPQAWADAQTVLKDFGTFIPGYRPGRRTAEYLEKVMIRITYVGAGFLALVAIVPTVVSGVLQVKPNVASFYGGTGLLIAVSVAFDLIQKIDSHLVMRDYRGLLEP